MRFFIRFRFCGGDGRALQGWHRDVTEVLLGRNRNITGALDGHYRGVTDGGDDRADNARGGAK